MVKCQHQSTNGLTGQDSYYFGIDYFQCKMVMRIALYIAIMLFPGRVISWSQGPVKGKLIFSDEFTSLDKKLWIAEIAPQPGSSVYARDGQLFLDTKGGVTVWLNKKLQA